MDSKEILWVSPELYRATRIVSEINDMSPAEFIIECASEWVEDGAGVLYTRDGYESFIFRPRMELQFAMIERVRHTACDDLGDAYRSALLYHRIKNEDKYSEIIKNMFKN